MKTEKEKITLDELVLSVYRDNYTNSFQNCNVDHRRRKGHKNPNQIFFPRNCEICNKRFVRQKIYALHMNKKHSNYVRFLQNFRSKILGAEKGQAPTDSVSHSTNYLKDVDANVPSEKPKSEKK